MNISDYLLEFLKQYNQAEIKGFGVFSFQNSEAEIKANEKVILPPAKKVIFTSDKEVKGTLFLNFLAQKKDISLEHAKFELQTQVDFWQKKIKAKDEFIIPTLGAFQIIDDQFVFEGRRVEKDSPDFFGLEKINYNKLEVLPASTSEKSTKENKITAYVLWIFLIIIPIIGLAYTAYTYQDVLLGKKEMKDLSVKTSTHRIEDQPEVTPVVQADSITIDSLSTKEEIPQVVTP